METAVYGAVCNIKINLKDIKDETFRREMTSKAEAEMKAAEDGYARVTIALDERAC